MATARELVELILGFKTEGEQKVESAFDSIAASQATLEERTKRLRKEMRDLAKEMENGSVSIEEGADKYNKLQGELDQTEDKIKSLSSEAKSNSTRWTELASKVAVAKEAFSQIQQAGQVAIDTIKRGAEVQQVADTFDNLTASIGETSSMMLGALQNATQGMVSNFDLMTSANRFMAMGLATSSEEAAELAEVAVTLGQAMGVGPNQAMEDFALLLANQSIPRLDTFGISSGVVRERVNELTTGVNALDREAAFLQATMEEAEKTMVAVGGAAQGTLSDIAQLDADIRNLKDDASVLSATMAGPLIGSFADSSRSVKAFRQAREAGLITEKEQIKLIKEVIEELGNEATKAEVIEEQLRRLDEITQQHTQSLKDVNEATESYDRALIGASEAADEAAGSIGDLDGVLTEEERLFRNVAKAEAQANSEALIQGILAERAEVALRKENEAIAESVKAFEDYNEILDSTEPLVNDYIQAQEDMAEAQGEFVDVTRDNSAEIADINAQLFGDLDSDQRTAMNDLVSTAQEGGSEWIAAFDATQGDLTESQRNALVARKAELEASQGEITQVYTGDIAAFEEAQRRKLEAAAAFTQKLQENAFAIAEANIIAEGGDVIGNTQALLDLAVAQGLKTQEQADLQLAQTEKTLQTQEVTQQLMDVFLEDGVLAQEESERLANAVGLIGEGAELTTEQLVTLGLAGTEHADMITTAFTDTETQMLAVQGTADTISDKLSALTDDEWVINVKVVTTGGLPGDSNAATSDVMENAGVN